jgi:predicted RNA binding protein YcfA (HicA-like mRNA interferase family)
MSKTFSGKEMRNILVRKYGFQEVSQKGSHVKLVRIESGQKRITIIPMHRELATGTMNGLLRLAGIELADFLKKAKQ